MTITVNVTKYIPLKTGAWIMAFTNLVFALAAIFGGATELFFHPSEENRLYLMLCIVMGLLNLIAGITLVIAIISAKERYILFYILLEMVNLVILTIFAILNISHYPFASMSAILIGCSFLWYGLYLMYKFYLEIRDYNSVQSGVIEISCNTHPDPLIGLPERAVDSTAV